MITWFALNPVMITMFNNAGSGKSTFSDCRRLASESQVSVAAVAVGDSEPDVRPARGGAHDYSGAILAQYEPNDNDRPDPGEVVWAWVPYEEDHTVGKDRPLVIVGAATQTKGELAAFMLSSKEHGGDYGWVSIGAGEWDSSGRPSWVRISRPFAVPAGAVRREGATLNRQAFDAVVRAAKLNVAAPASTQVGPASAAGLPRLRERLARWLPKRRPTS